MDNDALNRLAVFAVDVAGAAVLEAGVCVSTLATDGVDSVETVTVVGAADAPVAAADTNADAKSHAVGTPGALA